MKNKLIALLACVCALSLAVFAFTGCNNSSSESKATDTNATDDTQETVDFVVGFDSGYPPYGYIADDGSYTGFDLELAEEVCKRNGWNFKAEPIDWDAKDALINSDAITCIWNGFTYEGRENDYAWSDAYMLNAQVIIVKADSGITDEAGLAGKNVVTQVDSAALEVLNGDKADLNSTFAGGSASTIDKYDNAFMQLESGAVDAVACDLSIAAYYMSAKPDVYAQVVTLSEEHYAVGFKLGNTEMAKKVTETLKAMDEDGFIEDLCEKYADDGISYSNWCL